MIREAAVDVLGNLALHMWQDYQVIFKNFFNTFEENFRMVKLLFEIPNWTVIGEFYYIYFFNGIEIVTYMVPGMHSSCNNARIAVNFKTCNLLLLFLTKFKMHLKDIPSTPKI